MESKPGIDAKLVYVMEELRRTSGSIALSVHFF